MAEDEPSVGRVDFSWKVTWEEESTQLVALRNKLVVLPYPGRSGAGVGGGTGSSSSGQYLSLRAFAAGWQLVPTPIKTGLQNTSSASLSPELTYSLLTHLV